MDFIFRPAENTTRIIENRRTDYAHASSFIFDCDGGDGRGVGTGRGRKKYP